MEKTIDIHLSVDVDESVTAEDLMKGIDRLFKYSEGVHTWGTKETDKLFVVGEETDTICSSCKWNTNGLVILAQTQEEADGIFEKGGGLCENCMIELIQETHGEVITGPKP